MNIHTNILLMFLERYNPRYSGLVRNLTFGSVVKEELGEEEKKGNLLVAHRSNIASAGCCSASCLVCIDDTTGPLSVPMSVPVIFVDNGETDLNELYLSVVNAVELTHSNDALKEKLLEMTAQDASLDNILREATKYLGNSFTVFSATYRLLAHSLDEKVISDTAKEAIQTRYLNEDLLKQLQKSGDLGKIQRSNKVELTALPNGVQKISVALRFRNTYLGLISMYNYHRPFTYADYDIMEYMRNLVYIQFHKNNYFFPLEGNEYRNFLADLLEYHSAPDVVNAKKKSLNLSFANRLLVMVVSPDEKARISMNNAMPVIQRHFENAVPNCQSLIYRGNIVCIFPYFSGTGLSSTVHGNVEELLSENKLYAGISNICDQLSNLKTYYEQGMTALQIGLRANSCNRLFFFHSFLLDYMLELSSRIISPYTLNHPAIDTLLKYDEEYNTDYYGTFKTYLDCNGNLSESAIKLNIHYNTMKYRMKMIKSIAEIDVSNLSILINLSISCKCREIMSENRK